VSVWGEVFLGIIAAATMAMAIVLVAVLIAATRLARQVGRLLDRLEVELTPLFGHLNAIGRDASRAAAIATGQVERIDRAINDLAGRLDHTLQALQATFVAPMQEGKAILNALAAVVGSMRAGRRHAARAEEDDALFI
jgi:hypothetical protein